MFETDSKTGTRAGTAEPQVLNESQLNESELDAIAGGGRSQCEGDDGSSSGGGGSSAGGSHGVSVIAYARVDGA